jgi:putative colanic acid biosynthesis glycosyltransferase
MKLLDIVTVTRNNLIGLTETYASIAEINLDPGLIQWIVIDGNSDDGTQEWLKNLNPKFNYEFISEDDSGLYDAMNKGIDRVRSRWVWFLNSGDIVGSEVNLQFLSELRASDSILVFDWGKRIGKRVVSKKARGVKYIKHGLITSHQAILYPGKLLNNFRYNLSYTIVADYEITARLLVRNNFKIEYFPFPICEFRIGGISTKQTKLLRLEASRVQREVLKLSSTKLFLSRIRHIISGILIKSIYVLENLEEIARGRL